MKYVTETKHVPLGFGEIAGGALDGQAVTPEGGGPQPAGHGRDHLPLPCGCGTGRSSACAGRRSCRRGCVRSVPRWSPGRCGGRNGPRGPGAGGGGGAGAVPARRAHAGGRLQAAAEAEPGHGAVPEAPVLRSLRTRSVFKVQEGISRAFREYLTAQGFTEIHTPKIVHAGAEGGSNIFRLDYFGRKAFLAQSPSSISRLWWAPSSGSLRSAPSSGRRSTPPPAPE